MSAAVVATTLLMAPLAYADNDNRSRWNDRDDRSSESSNASTSALQAQIENLKKMLSDLLNQRKTMEDNFKKQQEDMKKQEQNMHEQISQAEKQLKFNRSLYRGLSGDDVRDLQELLALDPDILDAASITGYFGPKTEKALRKWQKKHGISAIGIFGPASQAKLLALFAGKPLPPGIAKRLGIAFGNTTPGSGFVTICHKPEHGSAHSLVIAVPALGGHLAHGDSVGICGGTATTTPPATTTDQTAPHISNIGVTGLSQTNATINWNTNENATGRVYVGTTSPINLASAITSTTGSNTNHSIGFTVLNPGTTYYFVIVAKDAAGNTSTSTTATFTTGTDNTAPSISNLSVSGISSTTASINWNTNETATGKVYLSTTSPVNLASGLTQTTGASLNHSAIFNWLTQGTTYYFLAVATDPQGNAATSTTGTFTTNAYDLVAPVISSVGVSGISSTSASISWNTDENATGKVYYGTTSPVNFGSFANVSTSTLSTSRSLGLTGLSASTTYYYAVESKDSNGNTSTSSTFQFNTSN